MAKSMPGRSSAQFLVRFPEGMRERIAEEASKNNRSMNAEIISRLEESFSTPTDQSVLEFSPNEFSSFLATVVEQVKNGLAQHVASTVAKELINLPVEFRYEDDGTGLSPFSKIKNPVRRRKKATD